MILAQLRGIMELRVLDLFSTAGFWSAFLSWMIAQFTKLLCGMALSKGVDFKYFVSTGGMPSAHSATVSGLATSMGMTQGFDSPAFIISLTFAIITMFDASTVRRAAGQQAGVLNEMIDELFTDHAISQKKLKELLGHTRLEVFMGMLVGILVGVVVTSAYYLGIVFEGQLGL
jgi:acid phosphatase family membrane protein YuiD